ncbi:MAG: DNA cytosine methyltransferase [Methanoregula sp.]|jgi:DNA (cytosine-5)-methyltransferase 1|nr:DNA cytosine methyltransferase [Methanoregula sp.]
MTEVENRPVIVDMFCGSGGESQGINWAVEKAGIEIEMFAINHWERAIETHQANFPDAEHICRSVSDINPSDVVPDRKIALLWASPACTHFSNARGGKPREDQSRVTPFTVLDWLDKLTVDRVIIENVPEFQSWGPLDPETHRPIQQVKGETFRAYITMIQGLGYDIDWKILNAADYGAPTTRRRLFIQAARTGSGKSILWPEVTHIQPGPNRLLTGDLPPWVPARDIIDWSLPTQIIDERNRPLAMNTMKRILRGIEKYWGEYARPFLVRYNGGENRVHTVGNSLPVLDTSDRYGLVQPLVMCIGQTSSKGRVRSVDEPLATVVTKEEACLIEPLFIPQHSCGEVRPTTGPLSTALITPENVRLGFRMLKPHELASAQSFPRDYIFTGNRGEIVRQIGNAVCPKMAEALTSGYMQELAGVTA